jgi:WhiB family redox-sensing transcriptional regulator
MTVSTLNAEWWEVAACRDRDPELFFPVSAMPSAADARKAKLICASCPVRPQCLDFALRHAQEQGIWGGLTESERRVLRRVDRTRRSSRCA